MNSPLAASAHLNELVDCFATSYKTALTIGLFWKEFRDQNKGNNAILVLFKETGSSQFCKLSKTDKMLC